MEHEFSDENMVFWKEAQWCVFAFVFPHVLRHTFKHGVSWCSARALKETSQRQNMIMWCDLERILKGHAFGLSTKIEQGAESRITEALDGAGEVVQNRAPYG